MTEHYYTPRPSAPSRPAEIVATLRGRDLVFATDTAVFARGKVDKGTRLLIEQLPLPLTGAVLDLGCGYGPVGLVIAALSPDARVWLVDVNERAAALAAANVQRNGLANATVLPGDGFAPVHGQKFDLIASNPPIRAGKAVIYPWVELAYEHLLPGGQLMLVVRTSQGAKSLARKMKEVFGQCDEVGKGAGYRVLAASRSEVTEPAQHLD